MNKQILKIFSKNWNQNLIILFTLIISLLGFLGTDYALNNVVSEVYQSAASDNVIDLSYHSNFDNFTSFNSLKIEETNYSIPVNSCFRVQYLLTKNNFFTKNLSLETFPSNSSEKIIYTVFLGIDFQVFSQSRLQNIFYNNLIPNKSKGIYISPGLMNLYNFSVGDHINHFLIDNDYSKTNPETEVDIEIIFENLTIGGILNPYDDYKFMQIFSLSDEWQYFDVIFNYILIDTSYLYPNFIQPTAHITHLRQNNDIKILLNRESLNFQNPNKLKTQFDTVDDEIRNDADYNDLILVSSYESPLLENIGDLKESITIFRYIYPILSIPLLFFSWWLIKIANEMVLEKNSKTIEILRSNGISKNEIKKVYLVKAILIGIFGGLIGMFSSLFFVDFLSRFLIKSSDFEFFLVDSIIPISTIIFSIILGIGLSISSSSISLKKLLNKSSIFSSKQELSKTKDIRILNRSKFLLVISFIPIIFSLIPFEKIAQGEPGMGMDSGLEFLKVFFSFLAPFSPFLIIYAILHILLENPKKFQKILMIFEKIKIKKIKLFMDITIKNISRQWQNSLKNMLIISITITFLFQISILNATIEENNRNLNLIAYGIYDNGFSIDYTPSNSSYDFYQEVNQNLYEEKSNLNYSFKFEMISIGEEQLNIGDLGFSLLVINVSQWKEYIEIPDRWVSEDLYDICEKLSQPNTILASNYYLTESDKEIEDSIILNYKNINEIEKQKEMTIIGSYLRFPFLYSTKEKNPESRVLICDISNLYDGKIDGIRMSFSFSYKINTYDHFKAVKNSIKNIDISGEILDITRNQNRNVNNIEIKLMEYVEIEAYNFSIIAICAFAIIIKINSQNSFSSIVKYRLKGMSKKNIFLIFLKQNIIYFILSFILAILVVLLGLFALINGLYSAEFPLFFERNIVIPWSKIFIMTFYIFSVTLVITIIILKKIINQTNRSKIEKYLMMD